MREPLKCSGQHIVLKAGGSVSPSELSAQLGVSLQTISEWQRRHNCPRPVRNGKRWEFKTQEIGAWLSNHGALVSFYE